MVRRRSSRSVTDHSARKGTSRIWVVCPVPYLPSEYSASTDSLTMYSSVLELFAGFTSRWALAGVAPVTSRPQPSVSATSQWGNSRRDRCRPARFIIRAVPVRILHDRPKRAVTLRYPWRSDGILGPTIHATVD